jgi:small subunit ribosomal protein S15
MASITKEKTAELIAKFGKNEKDTGNVRVQVAILTERIRNLTEHVKIHRKDVHTTRGLTNMVSQRRSLLNYYTRNDINGYRQLIQELGLRR